MQKSLQNVVIHAKTNNAAGKKLRNGKLSVTVKNIIIYNILPISHSNSKISFVVNTLPYTNMNQQMNNIH